MMKLKIASAIVASILSSSAFADGLSSTGGVVMCLNGSGQAVPCGPANPLSVAGVVGGTPVPVTGTFSATLGGFAPSGNYATLAVTTSTGNVALPAGSPAVVVVYNTGSNPVYVKLGTSNAVTATTGDDYIPAGGAMALTVGSNTYLAAISTGGSTSINLSGGSGLATGWGGGSGGGGTVTQGTAASSGPWIFTPWVAGSAMSATNGFYTNLLQGNAVIGSGNPLFAQLTAGATTIGNVNQTAGTAGFSKITDGTNGPAAVKAASTAAATTDPALVVALSPNGLGTSATPIFAQLTAGGQGGSASLPIFVYPGTGATWNIGTGGLGSAAAPLSMAGAASSNYAPSQVSVAATATSLIAARSGGRNAVIITNMSTTPVFLGGSGVTAATGGYLAGVVGAAKVLPYNGAIYGITATGTASVSVEEIY